MNKIVVAGVSATIIVLVILKLFSWWSGLTLYFVADQPPGHEGIQSDFQRGDIISPLAGLNFEQGEWTVYLLLTPGDYEKLSNRFSRNCLKLADPEVLKRMQQDWQMVCQGGDFATVVSQLVFIRNGKVEYSIDILLTPDGRESLQSSSHGAIEPKKSGIVFEYLDKFEPVNSPVIILGLF